MIVLLAAPPGARAVRLSHRGACVSFIAGRRNRCTRLCRGSGVLLPRCAVRLPDTCPQLFRCGRLLALCLNRRRPTEKGPAVRACARCHRGDGRLPSRHCLAHRCLPRGVGGRSARPEGSSSPVGPSESEPGARFVSGATPGWYRSSWWLRGSASGAGPDRRARCSIRPRARRGMDRSCRSYRHRLCRAPCSRRRRQRPRDGGPVSWKSETVPELGGRRHPWLGVSSHIGRSRFVLLDPPGFALRSDLEEEHSRGKAPLSARGHRGDIPARALLTNISTDAKLVGARATTFIFFGMALVVGGWLATLHLAKRRVVVQAATIGIAVVCFIGSTLYGGGPLPGLVNGPYIVGAHERSLGPPSFALANWASTHLPAGSRVAVDRDNGALLNDIGRVDPVSPLNGSANPSPLFFDQRLTLSDFALIRKDDIRYVVTDSRLTEGLPLYGAYIAPGETRNPTLLTMAELQKFNSIPGVYRIYDNGAIQVYDLSTLLGKQPLSVASGASGQPVSGTSVAVPVLRPSRSGRLAIQAAPPSATRSNQRSLGGLRVGGGDGIRPLLGLRVSGSCIYRPPPSPWSPCLSCCCWGCGQPLGGRPSTETCTA